MLYTIYLVYIDSLVFIWRNPVVVLPYFGLSAISFLVNKYLVGDSISERFLALLLPYFVFSSVEIFTTLLVGKREVYKQRNISIWGMLKAFYERSISLFLLMLCVVFAVGFISALVKINFEVIVLLFSVFGFAVCIFSLKYLIFYDENSLKTAIWEGTKVLYKGFLFYFLVFLLGFLIARFPSLLAPSIWLTMPVLPVAELNAYTGNMAWFVWVVSPVLSSLQFIALTFAFLYKNRNKIPNQLNLNSSKS